MPHFDRSRTRIGRKYGAIEYGGLPVNHCMLRQMNHHLTTSCCQPPLLTSFSAGLQDFRTAIRTARTRFGCNACYAPGRYRGQGAVSRPVSADHSCRRKGFALNNWAAQQPPTRVKYAVLRCLPISFVQMCGARAALRDRGRRVGLHRRGAFRRS